MLKQSENVHSVDPSFEPYNHPYPVPPQTVYYLLQKELKSIQYKTQQWVSIWPSNTRYNQFND